MSKGPTPKELCKIKHLLSVEVKNSARGITIGIKNIPAPLSQLY